MRCGCLGSALSFERPELTCACPPDRAGAMSGAQYGQDLDGDGIIDTADNDSGSSGERSLFGQALSFLKSDRTEVKDDIDEDDVVQKHNVAYGWGPSTLRRGL